MKILILGATGMLGSAAFRLMSQASNCAVHGTVRQERGKSYFEAPLRANLAVGVDVENLDSVVAVFNHLRPDVVVNCIGVVKQIEAAHDPLLAIPVNAILPHRLARLCALVGARLIHISSDCVFNGSKGNYTEDDVSDAADLYGRSKFLGEVDYPNAVTLRTSIIGRELSSCNGLVDWFLSQEGRRVRGFRKAIFSGLTTDELTRVMMKVVDMPELRGVFHVSSAPIDKFSLLCLLRDCYGASIEIDADEAITLDRSLDSRRFRQITGYAPPNWPTMVSAMRNSTTPRAA